MREGVSDHIQLVCELVETNVCTVVLVRHELHVEDVGEEDVKNLVELFLRLWQVLTGQQPDQIRKIVVTVKRNPSHFTVKN